MNAGFTKEDVLSPFLPSLVGELTSREFRPAIRIDCDEKKSRLTVCVCACVSVCVSVRTHKHAL